MPALPPLTDDGHATTVVGRLLEVAAAQPGAVAVGDAVRQLTYSGLLAEAAAVSDAVARRNPDRHPVGVLCGHGVGAVVAIVGVVVSGSPVVVLDPTTPAARLRSYVDSAGAVLCVADEPRVAVAREVCGDVVVLDGRRADLRVVPPRPGQPTALAFTSGSTGRPKGVASGSAWYLHDAYTNATATGCYGPGDTVAALLPMAFSAGLGLTIAGLVSGATQQLFDPRTRPVRELSGWLREVGATVLVASPAILRGIVASSPPGTTLDGLAQLTMAGETVHAAELEAVRRLVGPACVIRNRYGSTETGLICEHVMGPGEPLPPGATPVGRPVAGVRLLVRDEHGSDAATGTGRLVVQSRWLTDGYWRAPEATAEVFRDLGDGVREFLTSDAAVISDDGTVRLLGRTDHSVKIRGHLVEPGEVDALLFAQPEIREAVTVGVVSEDTGRARLVSYVVPAGGRLEASSVRRVVRAGLPAFMVPEQVVLLPALPRTERGKLDRAALPPAPVLDPGACPPLTDWERVVAGVFARVLGLERVGRDADFFALGGDSLAAEELLAAVASELDVPGATLSTALLAEAPTVEAFAEAVRRHRRPAHPTLVRLREHGDRPPLFCLAGAGAVAVGFRPLAQRLPADQPVYALQAHGLEGSGRPDGSVEEMAARALRTLRDVRPHGPYRLAGHSLGALVALEVAHRLRAEGEDVELLAVLDSFPPDPSSSPSPFEGGPLRRLKRAVAIATAGVVPDRVGNYSRFHLHGMAVARRYRGRPWAGRTLVVVASDDPSAQARAAWGPWLAGPSVTVHVAGDHVGMLHEPHVGALAEALTAELAALGAAVPGLDAAAVSERG
ncbi:AMP-binding protein [Geodermatophilus nigrescens]|uniref:Acyl-CoA synthetase (AMP-forming)/AMP-acid ligase II n=1 Tax=Geodermatophilus nigrescens TaxID=1070870 RepID=A0A1M5D7D9_9ACTN|nr:AMP-binding protein [Geodermatophilus nigrescens]SHF62936.1 Acyl-CoA synthetase (AMP-forming)/AMP-acid ligase II [Geodermatophilus nigrescens]